jgi:hypothetical protein
MRLQYQWCADYSMKFRQQQFPRRPLAATVILKQKQSAQKYNFDNMSFFTFTSILKAHHDVLSFLWHHSTQGGIQ